MAGILDNVKTWATRKSVGAPNGSDKDHKQHSDDAMQRALKRKADPYDDVDGGDDEVARTPVSQRISRSRVSSEVPSSVKTRASPGKIVRRNVSTNKRPTSSSSAPSSGLARPPTQSQSNGDSKHHGDDEADPRNSRAPVADMGGAAEADESTKPGPTAKSSADTAQKPIEQDAERLLVKALEDGRNDEADGVHEVEKLLGYKRLGDGTIQIKVKWADEPASEATYEPEEEIQKGAAETLYNFWEKSYGGRSHELFEKDANPPAEKYFVFKVLSHQKEKNRFLLEVQWVGYPPDDANTTWEPEAKLKAIAKEALDTYWTSKGGRDKFVAKRGRAKKQKTA